LHSTYGELARDVAAIGTGLRRHVGLANGDRAAIFMTNVPEYVVALFAIWHAGLVAVPLNAKLHPVEVKHILRDCGARVCFVTADLASKFNAAPGATEASIRIIEVGDRDWQRLLHYGSTEDVAEPCERAWIFYTSGTTGKPKGAVLSHANLLAMTASFFMSVDAPGPPDSLVHAAPMSHGSGLYILPYISAAAANVVPDSGGFEPDELERLLQAYKGVALFAAPTMVQRLIRNPHFAAADTRNLRSLIYGGGPMFVSDCLAALELLGEKLVQIYGLGESPMTGTVLSRYFHGDRDHPRYLQRLASIGVAQAFAEVAIVDASGTQLPVGQVGEIALKGPAVMKGYWNATEATDAVLAEGWFRTGDLGEADADGFVTLKGRSKDLVISGGTNIYPKEVEDVLMEHPMVSEVAVIGAADPEWGERVIAFVVARSGAAPSAPDLDAHCLQHLARFKRPKQYRFVKNLPKNHYGKVVKKELRDQWALDAKSEDIDV